MSSPKTIVIAISGASGVSLGLKFAKALPEPYNAHIITTEHAKTVLSHEEQKRITLFDDHNIAAPSASGSFGAHAMIVLPCSMNTLAKIACGLADNLTTRAASVMLKERRPLILAPREMPFSAIALENMHKLSVLGVEIAPPIMGYYANISTLEAMEDFMIGKWFDLLMRRAIYPGTFDPVTIGHLDIIQRALTIFDEVIVGVSVSRDKNPMFSLENRIEMMECAVKGLEGVSVKPYDALTADFAQSEGVKLIVRGLRAVSDFEYELQIAYANRSFHNEIETVCLMSSLDHAFISSSVVRSILKYGGDVSHLVPASVNDYICEHMRCMLP